MCPCSTTHIHIFSRSVSRTVQTCAPRRWSVDLPSSSRLVLALVATTPQWPKNKQRFAWRHSCKKSDGILLSFKGLSCTLFSFFYKTVPTCNPSCLVFHLLLERDGFLRRRAVVLRLRLPEALLHLPTKWHNWTMPWAEYRLMGHLLLLRHQAALPRLLPREGTFWRESKEFFERNPLLTISRWRLDRRMGKMLLPWNLSGVIYRISLYRLIQRGVIVFLGRD